MDQPNNVAEELAAALNGHQVTDEEGQVQDETDTSSEKPAAPEAQTTEEKSEEAEAPKAPQAPDDQAEAEDESGNRYVPKSRFDKVYGKLKEAERKLEEKPRAQAQPPTQSEAPAPTQPVDATTALEVEVLKGKLPQFDPESEQYSPALDQMGADIYQAAMKPDPSGKLVPTITRMEAARRAIKYAKELAGQVAEVRAEARTVKAIQSDQGITSHVASRTPSQPDFDSMSDAEIEAYLRKTGQW